MLVDVVGWVVVGLLAGWFAKGLVEQSSYSGYGVQGDFGFGLLGALLGGIIARVMSIGGSTAGFSYIVMSTIIAALGSIIALALARATTKVADGRR